MAQSAVRTVRVAVVSSSGAAGGTERYLTLLLESLGPGWITNVVCLGEGPFAERLRRQGYATEVVATSKRVMNILTSAWKLRKILRGTDAMVVHADNLKAALISVVATRGSGIPVVWVKHDFSWDGRLARLVARGCTYVVGVSSSVTRTFRDQRTPVRVVHNGLPPLKVDREAGRRLMLSALGPPTPSAVVALVGRLHPLKGHRELLAIVPAFREHVPGIRFVFLGGEDYSEIAYAHELSREAAASSVSDLVTFLGHREDSVELISGCDLVVIPTITDPKGFGREGFSYVALEALAVGTPVVGYAHGGLPEVLGDCGLLVSPGDRTALRDAIVRLLQHPDLRERLAICGRRRVAERFSLNGTMECMKEVYRQAAKMTENERGAAPP